MLRYGFSVAKKASVGVCLVAAVFASLVSASEFAEEDDVRLATERRVTLAQAGRVLAEGDSTERFAALREVLHLASQQAVLSVEVERLLIRATADPADEIASLAERALDLRRHPPRAENVSEEDSVASETTADLDWIEDTLTRYAKEGEAGVDARSAARLLAHHATRRSAWGGPLADRIEWLIDAAGRHDDPEVRRTASALLAKQSGVSPKQLRQTEMPEEVRDLFVRTQDAVVHVRLDALERLMDLALNDDGEQYRDLLSATLAAATLDPDRKVAAYAKFMVAGLAGDANALRQMVVSKPPALGLKEDRNR